MDISFLALEPKDISFLSDSNGLYLLDFRAISESMDYEITAMRKYENLLPRVVSEGSILVNQYAHLLTYPNKSNLIEISYENYSPKTSICKRMQDANIINDQNKNTIYSFIPHPDVDNYCSTSGKTNFYSYSSFQIYNNKLKQKECMGDLTTKRGILDPKIDFQDQIPNTRCYIKRDYGSGGYTVFDSQGASLPSKEEMDDGHKRYRELYATGKVMSVQCVKVNQSITVFGFIEQRIIEERYFAGGIFLSVEELSKTALGSKIQDCLQSLGTFLSDYNGFFGIDFIVGENGEGFAFLEANVRLTAMTIPTLLHNQDNKRALFMEDADIDGGPDFLLLNYDQVESKGDVLYTNKTKDD